ncbi:MAG TPA: hybrid sensor histidine kinase/response regulator [Armatimonadota bacterium]|nr:hybrid sensor histidine kinase/response regulator [Armatimonadota bacterium]HPO71533.1 hybrid sensor histidine kinase/response regulator [Armatimonadota bacterium]
MGFDWTGYIQTAKTEIRERLQALNEGLLRLESEPGETALIDELFRHAHSIKGSAQMVGLDLVSRVAHGLEDALGAVRSGKLSVSPPLLDVSFQTLDLLERLLEDPPDQAALSQAEGLAEHLAAIGAGGPVSRYDAAALMTADAGGEEGVPDGPATPALPAEGETEWPEAREQAAPERPAATAAPAAAGRMADVMRVPIERVDHLLQLVGELASLEQQGRALAEALNAHQAQLRRFRGSAGSPEAGLTGEQLEKLEQACARASRLVRTARRLVTAQAILGREIRDAAMDLRLLPVATLFERFPRPVRDLARAAGKEVRLVIEGEETRLDKRILDELYDPILHLLRNAVDHGIEPPAERVEAGKPEQGTILLRAMPRGRTVCIEVSDDGRGISIEKVRQAACDRALITPGEAAGLTEDQVLQLLFRPGFSTATQVTSVSGRGVGLDVVYSNVHDLKGVVRLENRPGEGATFSLEIPLTLATTRVLLLECGGVAYALPGALVQGVMEVDAAAARAACGQQVISWKGRTVPLWPLDAVLGRSQRPPAGNRLAVLVTNAGSTVGLMVDRLLDEEEVVLKPVGALLESARLVTAGAVLGDGRIALLLDVDAVVKAASHVRAGATGTTESESARRYSILLADDALTTREVERAILEAAGYEVTAVADGQAAWEQLARRSFDLVVTDVEMPRMDGIALTQQITSDPRTARIPVIIISSLAKEEDRRRGLEAGAAAYIVKSAFDQENLLDLIERLIR